jgi:4-hydroxybenzoate decarboxylase subunit C
LWAYPEAGFHNLIVASVKQRFEKEALKTGLWILGEGQLALSKCVILVDPEVNARHFPSVLKAIKENFDPAEDFILLPHTSQDTLDFTSHRMNLGSKMILDATRGSQKKGNSSNSISNTAQIKNCHPAIKDVVELEGALLLLKVKSEGRAVLEKLAMEKLPHKIIAAVSSDIPLDDAVLRLWGLFTRFDCERDTFFPEASWRGGHPHYKGPLLIDATWKTGYPQPLSMTEEIIAKVDRRWKEYGFKEVWPSPNRG